MHMVYTTIKRPVSCVGIHIEHCTNEMLCEKLPDNHNWHLLNFDLRLLAKPCLYYILLPSSVFTQNKQRIPIHRATQIVPCDTFARRQCIPAFTHICLVKTAPLKSPGNLIHSTFYTI
ncbi:unnamed protein product [Dicrocoelium dendriticum]|nr:unnamed protein product [Dicrocoelium dendriticum]